MGNEKDEWHDIWIEQYFNNTGTEDLTYPEICGEESDWMDYKDWIKIDQNTHDNITLTGGGEEMLRIEKDGFYVRGVRVEADAHESKQVYEAFKQWLSWNILSNNNN